MPSQWFAELERDERVITTALDVMQEEYKRQNRPARSNGGTVTSG